MRCEKPGRYWIMVEFSMWQNFFLKKKIVAYLNRFCFYDGFTLVGYKNQRINWLVGWLMIIMRFFSFWNTCFSMMSSVRDTWLFGHTCLFFCFEIGYLKFRERIQTAGCIYEIFCIKQKLMYHILAGLQKKIKLFS